MAEKIMIVRHGEKPGQPIDAPGIDEHGKPDPHSLTAAGWARASALAGLFHPIRPGELRPGIAVPTQLYAAGLSDPDSSRRPLETLTPLARSFDPVMTIDDSIDATHAEGIAAAAMSAAGVVLIAWKHEFILDIAAIIAPQVRLPKKWRNGRFDMIFVFDDDRSGGYTFSQIPELVNPGDSAKPM